MELTKISPSGEHITRSQKFWDIVEMSTLRNLFYDEELTVQQMADRLGRSHSATEKKLAKMGLHRNMDAHKQRYSDDFKRTVILFYSETNTRLTCEEFGLEQRQLEGILRRARNLKGMSPMKIGERKNEWKITDILMALRYVGLKPSSFIAIKISRTESSIESYFKRRGYRLHYVNGLRQDDFNANFRTIGTIPFIRNLEGDVFVPWVSMEEGLEMIHADLIQTHVIKAMAKFQRFLHGCKTNKEVIIELWNKIEE